MSGTLRISTAVLLAFAVALAADFRAAEARGGSGKGGSHAGRGHSGKSHGGRHFSHSRTRTGITVIGVGGLWPWGYYAPRAAYGVPYAYAEAPPVHYIERSQEDAPAGIWLYCAKAQGYFPYVAECADGWETVPVVPPGASTAGEPTEAAADAQTQVPSAPAGEIQQ